MDIIERLDAAIKTEDFWVGDQREDNILKDSKKIIEQLRETLELVVVYWDEWMGKDGDPLALSLEEVVAAARKALKEKE
jgi:hypothetical protein